MQTRQQGLLLVGVIGHGEQGWDVQGPKEALRKVVEAWIGGSRSKIEVI